MIFHRTPASGSSRRWLTGSLLLAGALLTAGIWIAARPAPRVVLRRNLPDFPPSPVRFQKTALPRGKAAARIANVQIVDFDGDGLNDLLVCDVARNAVILYRQKKDHSFEEKILAAGLNCPVHAVAVDLDQDGDLDVVVAILGNIFPSDEVIGKVMVLENDHGTFTPHVLLDDVRRVADVEPGDFNGDGKIDLAVAVFGYARGEILWLENMGKKEGRWQFRDHQLLDRPGTIHVPVGDLNGDGRPDIAAVVSQDEEEVWVFENLGHGEFQRRRIYANPNYDVGSAGLILCDLNKDGRLDLLLPQGDNLEDRYSWPQPYHGCVWLENRGNWNFQPKQIARFGGTYAAAVADVDGDGFLDVILVSYLTDGSTSSVVWLKNDGHQNFSPHSVDKLPVGLVTVAAGELTSPGHVDIVAGGLHLPPFPETNYERITIWRQLP